ncbi:MAG: tRNA lysidine(34) synthetase TilS [Clostridia bacterium]|nr:tRNA lysidine(34) synthetase TilS [Clostridia bacterium]
MIDKTLLKHGETIAVALSGGKDSVCLLHLLLSVKNELSLSVKAVHVNHSIRGAESDRDEEFVKNLCSTLGVELKVFTVDAPLYSKENNLSLEQGARLLRYRAFNELISDSYCEKIATAHHKNDNFETVLFNLFRGSGISGLSGIKSVNNCIIRPISHLSREDIENYVLKNRLGYVEDSTNKDTVYTRNFIRKEIVPKILERFPEALDSAHRLSKIASEEDEFLNELALQALQEKGDKIYLSFSTPSVLFKRATIIAFKKLGLNKDYEYQHVLQVENLKNSQSGAFLTLPKGIFATKEYDCVIFSTGETKKQDVEIPFSEGKHSFLNETLEISSEILDKPYLLFDGDKIPTGSVIRTRRDGDVFTKFGGGTKKLKDYLIDKKIPLSERDTLPIIAKGNVVYLVFGVEISDLIRVSDNTINKLKAKIL